MVTFQHRSPSKQLFGSWNRRDRFLLGVGVNAVVTSIQKYTFRSDGTGMYSYRDNSGLLLMYAEREFTFEVDDTQIIFQSNDSIRDSVAIEFRMAGNKLILDYGGLEEVYMKDVTKEIVK